MKPFLSWDGLNWIEMQHPIIRSYDVSSLSCFEPQWELSHQIAFHVTCFSSCTTYLITFAVYSLWSILSFYHHLIFGFIILRCEPDSLAIIWPGQSNGCYLHKDWEPSHKAARFCIPAALARIGIKLLNKSNYLSTKVLHVIIA